MKKLCVAGCSFSDYTKVEETYGEILSNKLGYKYIHEGAGCGSNWRMWRTITNHILDGKLTSDDLVIVQYTEVIRCEFWSSFPNYYFKSSAIDIPIADKSYDGGGVLRYKVAAGTWQHNPEENEFFTKYEENFVNLNFEEERFRVHNYNFQQMLKNHNIKAVFLTTGRLPPKSEYVIDHFKKYEFVDPLTPDRYKYNLSPEDSTHMSQEGHKELAERLYKHVTDLGLVKE